MEVNSIYEAKAKLSKLVDLALKGEEVIIGKAGKPLVKLTPHNPDRSPRKGGQWRGKVHIAPDFNESCEQIELLFGTRPI